MARQVVGAVVAVAVGVLAGCTGVARKLDPSAPPLIIGPEGAAKAPPSELPPKQAAEACAASARELEKHGQTDEAVTLYLKARALDPEGQKAICRRLAVLYDLKAEFSKAAAEYEEALKLYPKDADLLNDLGYSYYSRGEWAKAEETLRQATTMNPSNKRAWMNLGLATAVQGRTADSMASFTKVVTEAEARCNVAFVLATLGKPEEAKAEYRRALALAPDLKLAQVALHKLENPEPTQPVEPAAKAGKPADKSPAKPVRVPTIEELEARLNLTPPVDNRPVIVDPAGGK